MLDWSQRSAVERNPDRVSGAWVFKNTRVPVRALFENIEGDATVRDFIEWFPGVQIHHSKDLVNWTIIKHVFTAQPPADHFAVVMPDVRQKGDVARLLEKMGVPEPRGAPITGLIRIGGAVPGNA